MTMAPQAHFDFFVRCILLFVIMLLRQLPRHYNVHVDRDIFLSAFSAENEGETMRATNWELGPEGAVHQEPNPDAPREQACARYKELYAHVAPGIHRADNEYPEPGGRAGRRELNLKQNRYHAHSNTTNSQKTNSRREIKRRTV